MSNINSIFIRIVIDVFCEWAGPMVFFDGQMQRIETDNEHTFSMVHVKYPSILF
jgi:hypothetical protein